ncbi:hypothetical protein M406DRAFT_106881 [Cryphonectria parasitica EP155]|uniref:DUF7730 domain-containing protein n=1 Tax=Cryphonectria parasitica (strain ATCC 38755 / EP155) TaxID=660469 RepID=A0A9P5CR13_CRYP1|nr:uncharacterized protein M406DRAFT_106881 [Cryphonectria parasitica EP155]KAF3768079.1 hypothetical protein M406DRAFT_106881 [Cryphonectria parasitica EP155]
MAEKKETAGSSESPDSSETAGSNEITDPSETVDLSKAAETTEDIGSKEVADNSKQVAVGPQERTSPVATGHTNSPLFTQIPVDIRLRIYTYVFYGSTLELRPDKHPEHYPLELREIFEAETRPNRNATDVMKRIRRHPYWEYAKILTSFHYSLLLTCRAIYKEGLVTYWGETVLLGSDCDANAPRFVMAAYRAGGGEVDDDDGWATIPRFKPFGVPNSDKDEFSVGYSFKFLLQKFPDAAKPYVKHLVGIPDRLTETGDDKLTMYDLLLEFPRLRTCTLINRTFTDTTARDEVILDNITKHPGVPIRDQRIFDVVKALKTVRDEELKTKDSEHVRSIPDILQSQARLSLIRREADPRGETRPIVEEDIQKGYLNYTTNKQVWHIDAGRLQPRVMRGRPNPPMEYDLGGHHWHVDDWRCLVTDRLPYQ